MPEIVEDLSWKLLHRRDHVGEASLNSHPWHAVEFGRGGCLNEDRSGFFFDRAQAQSAIRAMPERMTPMLVLPLIFSQRAEKEINRQT